MDNKTASEIVKSVMDGSKFVRNTNCHRCNDLNLGLSADGGVHIITQKDPEVAESISEDLCLIEVEDFQFGGYHVGKARLFPMKIADRFATTTEGLNSIYTAEEKARQDLGKMLKELPSWGEKIGEMVEKINNIESNGRIARRKAEWAADEEEIRHQIMMAKLRKELEAIEKPTTDFENVD